MFVDKITSVMESYKLVVSSVFVLSFIQFLLYYFKNMVKKKNMPPGPKGLPIIGNLLQVGDRPHESLAKLAKIHGPLMTVNLGFQTIVVAHSADMAGEILQKQDQAFLGRPLPHAVTAERDYHRSVAWMSGGPKWRSLRKMMTTHVFTTQRIDALQGLRIQMLDDMVNSLVEASKAKQSFDIGNFVFGTAFNLTSHMIFSGDVLDKKSDDVGELHQLIKNIITSLSKPNLSDSFPILKPFDPQGIRRELQISYGRLQDLIDKLIEQRMERRKSGVRSDDLLNIFLDQCKDSSNFDEFNFEDVNPLVLDLFVGAAATTAATTEWAMAELLRNPQAMAKAKQELREILGSASQRIDEKMTQKLPYLQSVIKETMRLHGVAALLVHMTLVDTEIGGYTIPKNTQVMVNGWALGRDPSYWVRAEEFVPDRFLEPDVDPKRMSYYFFPFGLGRRMCPGYPLASRMLGVVLASLIHRFDWKLPDGMRPDDVDMSDKFGLSLQKIVPLIATPVEVK